MSADSGSTRIVVGIDGSPGSRAALSWAIDEALGRHAALELLRDSASGLIADAVVAEARSTLLTEGDGDV